MRKQQKQKGFRHYAGRIAASIGEFLLIMMFILLLSTIISYGYLQMTAPPMVSFASLTTGLVSYLFLATICTFIPIIVCFVIAEEFEENSACDGYVFDAVIKTYDKIPLQLR